MLVQAMAGPGVEVFVGVKQDPQFGPMVMFGPGGIFVELFRDVALRRPPFSERDAWKMIRETKAYPLMKGFRGKPPADLGAVVRILTAVSRLALDWQDHFTELDINPVIVFPEGRGAQVLDCLFITAAG
jgi:acetyltransferase